MITTELIKELRDATGVSVMQCKKALEEAEGNMEKALMILKKKSGDIAMKKADREAHDGVVVTKKSGDKVAVIVLNCETDFVAKNEDFMNLANTLADISLSEGIEVTKTKASDVINPVIQKVGENIQLNRIGIFEGDTIGAYVHNGKSGVVVQLKGGNEEVAKDIAMHVAAMKPEYIRSSEIKDETKEMAREMFNKEIESIDKPAEIKAKMLEGKMNTYFKERVLLEQPFIKDDSMTISALLGKFDAELVDVMTFGLS
jgi:elongation factor Ts